MCIYDISASFYWPKQIIRAKWEETGKVRGKERGYKVKNWSQ